MAVTNHALTFTVQSSVFVLSHYLSDKNDDGDDGDDNERHFAWGKSLVPNDASLLYGLCVCLCHCNSMLGTPGWRADKTHPALGINVHTRCRFILVYNYIGAYCVVHPPWHCAAKTYVWVEEWLHSFLIWALDANEWLALHAGHFVIEFHVPMW
jgi:hypothetical protein